MLRYGGLIISIAALALLSTFSIAAQTEPVTYHDLSTMPRSPLGNMQVRGALGKSASFAIAEMPTGMRGRAGNPHWHTQEQIVIGVNGSTIMSVGGMLYRLGSYGAVVPPANVEHAQINGSATGPSTFIEFQPVLRPDWFPPNPAVTSPKSVAPVVMSADTRVFEDLAPASEGWRAEPSGARSKTLSGQTVKLSMWDLSTAKTWVDVTAPGVNSERFVYIFDGQAEIAIGTAHRNIASEMLVVVSSAADAVRLRSSNNDRTVVGVFESITR